MSKLTNNDPEGGAIVAVRGFWDAIYLNLLSLAFAGRQFSLRNRNNQIFFRHQRVLGDKVSEPQTQIRFLFELVKYSPVVVVRMRENSIDPPTNGSELRH